MSTTLSAILRGRPAVAYGAGEYFGRFCDRTADVFAYLLDDALAGQSRHGVPIRPVASLAAETREVCIFLFCRDAGRALLELAEYGYRWGENVFDARAFGDGTRPAENFRLFADVEAAFAEGAIELSVGRDARMETGRVLVRETPGQARPGIFLAEDARLDAGDLLLSSGARLCAGRSACITLAPATGVPGDFLLNVSLGSTAKIGAGVVFSPHGVINTASYTSVRIGAGSTFGPHLDLYAYAPIEIGAGCMFSSHVFVASGAGHDLIVNGTARPPRSVVLGERVWIGWSVQLLAGAELGAGSMAAAGSVVTGVFPERTMLGGVPARAMATDIGWDRDFTAYKRLFYPPTHSA